MHLLWQKVDYPVLKYYSFVYDKQHFLLEVK